MLSLQFDIANMSFRRCRQLAREGGLFGDHRGRSAAAVELKLKTFQIGF